LLREYIRNSFAGFIYDYKDFDLTKTAYNLAKKYSFPYQFYYISFADMDRTYRVNPIAPKVIQDENLFLQLIDDMLTAYMGENSRKDEWF
ncbi:mobilization protein, partial [Veillonellaceae bacterium M2-8]|nr:mobilization protein [Veillonellaceae bacterium M2-8]